MAILENYHTPPKVLVLLIGEVLDDPRVYKTCISLRNEGVRVVVGCTNPMKKPVHETVEGLTIFRFPHRGESLLKRIHHLLVRYLPSGEIRFQPPSTDGGTAPALVSRMKSFLYDLNFNHYYRNILLTNELMAWSFRGETFDLVHCNDVETIIAGSELSKGGNTGAALYDAHEYWAGTGTGGSKSSRVLFETEARCIKDMDYVVTVNPLIAGLLKDQHNLESIPSVVMNCPYRYDGEVHTDEIHSPVSVIFQGKMQAFRGLEQLVEAFKLVGNGVLTLSGYGPLEEKLRRLARDARLRNKIRFAGRYLPADSTRILSGHDIGVIPYEDVVLNNRYSSPNKLFDYAMAGLAVAASDLPFIASVVKGCSMGELFTGTDPGSIASTLNRLISDSELLKTCKSNARKAALENFCWETQFAGHYPWKPWR